MIWMQLKDLPLLLAGALGAAITGMVAPGLSFLFGEIQKVTTEPIKTNQFPGISPIRPYTDRFLPKGVTLPGYRYIEQQVLKRIEKSVFQLYLKSSNRNLVAVKVTRKLAVYSY